MLTVTREQIDRMREYAPIVESDPKLKALDDYIINVLDSKTIMEIEQFEKYFNVFRVMLDEEAQNYFKCLLEGIKMGKKPPRQPVLRVV